MDQEIVRHPIAAEALNVGVDLLVANGQDEAAQLLLELRDKYEPDHEREIHLCWTEGDELGTYMPGRCPHSRARVR